jgi:SAM-dependent methyltransferase
LTEILISRIGRRDLVGVEPDAQETTEARRRNFYTAIHTTGAERIPEVDGRFDFAISNSVLEHIPALDSVLAEVARVLKRGGILCLTVPHAGFRTQLAGPLMPGVSREDYEARLDRRLAHVNYLSAAEWRALLDRHGFVTEIMNFYVDRAQLQRWEMISRWTAGVLGAASGGRMHPVAIQRSMGLRQFQNRFNLPRPCAAVLARLLALGIAPVSADLTEVTSACVAIRCRKL